MIGLGRVRNLLCKYFLQLAPDPRWLAHARELLCVLFVELRLAFENWAYLGRLCQLIKQCPIVIILFVFCIIRDNLNCRIESSNLRQRALRYRCWQGKRGLAQCRRVIIESQALLELMSSSLCIVTGIE